MILFTEASNQKHEGEPKIKPLKGIIHVCVYVRAPLGEDTGLLGSTETL